jgi:hypothetical protein
VAAVPIASQIKQIKIKKIRTPNYFTAYEEFLMWNMFTVKGW